MDILPQVSPVLLKNLYAHSAVFRSNTVIVNTGSVYFVKSTPVGSVQNIAYMLQTIEDGHVQV